MKKTFAYFYLQVKRSARFFFFVFIISLAICLTLGCILNTLINLDTSSEKNRKLSIGIVGDASDSYLGFGISAIQSLDSSRYSVELVEMEEEEASKKLLRGEITAYIIIPEDFVDTALKGNIQSIPYVTTGASADIATLFKDEILEVVSCIFVESQKGIFGLQNSLEEYHPDYPWEWIDGLTVEYFSLILNRSCVFDTEIIGVSDSLSFSGYMFCGIIVLLMMLCGIPCCSLLIKTDMALPKLLNANRQNALIQVLGEYFAYFLMMLLNFTVILGVTVAAVGSNASFIFGAAEINFSWFVLLILHLIPVIFAITALQFLLYELSSGIAGGVLLQFLATIGLAYVSGCFYPINFFPESIQAVSKFIPLGIARSYLSGFLSESFQIADFIGLLISFALLFGASVLIRRERIIRA